MPCRSSLALIPSCLIYCCSVHHTVHLLLDTFLIFFIPSKDDLLAMIEYLREIVKQRDTRPRKQYISWRQLREGQLPKNVPDWNCFVSSPVTLPASF
jgi:transposase